MHTATLPAPGSDCAPDIDAAWLESLRGDSRLKTVAEEAGIEFPEDSPPRFVGELATVAAG